MAAETIVARESSARPLNATGNSRSQRVTSKVIGSIKNALNDSTSHDQYTEDLSYSKGVVTAYTMEKGYGDRRFYSEEYTSVPNRQEKGWRWTGRDAYAASVFNAFANKGIKIKKFVHHGQYD